MRVDWAGQQEFPSGHGNFSRSLQHAPPVVDRSVVRSFASVSRGKRVSSFPIGRWELSRSLQHVPTVVDRSVIRSCASESRSKRVSIFPIGAMGTFEVSVARTSCSSSERQTQWCKRESKQARQHFPSKQARQHFPHRGDGKFRG